MSNFDRYKSLIQILHLVFFVILFGSLFIFVFLFFSGDYSKAKIAETIIFKLIFVGVILAVFFPWFGTRWFIPKNKTEWGVCPKCGEERPIFRIPRNLSQTLKGGWTCKNCGSEINKQSRLTK